MCYPVWYAKLPHYRPEQAHTVQVKAPRFLDNWHMKVVGFQPYAPAAFTPRIILVLNFRGWVDPRAHGTVICYGKNPRWRRETIPGPPDL